MKHSRNFIPPKKNSKDLFGDNKYFSTDAMLGEV